MPSAEHLWNAILDNLQQTLDRFKVPRAEQDELKAIFNRAMRDAGEGKSAEDALRESEERYRLLTDLSPDGIVIVSFDGIIHLVNPSILRILGVQPTDMIGRSLFDFLAPDYWGHCQDCMKNVMTNDTPVAQVEAAFISRDGRNVPVEVSAVRFDWKGKPHAQIVIRDISGRRHAEAERDRLAHEIESERDRLWQILEQMPTGVVIVEAPTGRLLFHNVECLRLLRHPLPPCQDYKGYASYGAVHNDGSSYLPEEYPVWRSLMLREVTQGEEMTYRRGDGTVTIFSVNSAPIYNPAGQMVLAAVTFIDIADRKRAETELRESEERFEKAFQASPDALVISRIADGVILEANESFVALAGFERHEVIGKSTIQLGLYANPAARDRMLGILKAQNRVRDFELVMKRKSGEIRLITFSAEPFDLHGEHCWLTIGRDVTEKKQVEQQREQLLVQETAAREDAEAANRMKDEFLATISHELRTPLTSIMGWARILIDSALPEAQTHHALEVIEQSAKSQARLIDDILDTSRIITGRLILDRHPIDMEQVFLAAVDVIRPSAEAKGIELRIAIEGGSTVVFGDANRLQQAIWNLLSNAVKFTNEHGRIEARLTRESNQVQISVSDTGIGIDPQFLPYVFERFRQADSTSTRRYGGLGLGLAIVRHIVEMHGGAVEAASAGKGLGAQFKVRLPVAWSAQAPGTERHPPQAELRKPHVVLPSAEVGEKLDGVSVLVVEDDADTLELIRFVLDDYGAEVITASSVGEALEALDRRQPQALVSDLAMPGRDGYELIANLRSRSLAQGGNIPAIALTAYARPEDRARALAAGYQMHVAKPVDPKTLVAALASLTKAS